MKIFSSLSAILLVIVVALGCAPSLRAQSSSPTVYCVLHEEGNLALVNPETGKILRRIQVGRNPDVILLSRDGAKLYVANSGEISVSVVSLAENKVIQSIRMPVKRRGVTTGAMALSNDGKKLFVAERSTDKASSNVYIIDTQMDMIVGQISAGPMISAVSVSSDDSRLFVVNAGSGISAFEPVDKAQPAAVEALPGISAQVNFLACNPVSPTAYISYGSANKIQILNTKTLKTEGEIAMPKYHTGSQQDLAFSPDGKRAFVLNKRVDMKDIDGINVINTADNSVIKIFNAGDCYRGLIVSADNRSFFTGTNELKWYNLTTLEHIKSISLKTPIYGIALK